MVWVKTQGSWEQLETGAMTTGDVGSAARERRESLHRNTTGLRCSRVDPSGWGPVWVAKRIGRGVAGN